MQAKAARDKADHLAGWAEAVQALESTFMAELEAEFEFMCQAEARIKPEERRQTREQTPTKLSGRLPGKKDQKIRA